MQPVIVGPFIAWKLSEFGDVTRPKFFNIGIIAASHRVVLWVAKLTSFEDDVHKIPPPNDLDIQVGESPPQCYVRGSKDNITAVSELSVVVHGN